MLRKQLEFNEKITLKGNIGNKLQKSIFREIVIFIADEIDSYFVKNANFVKLKSEHNVSRTIHNLQVLMLIFDYYYLFTDKKNNNNSDSVYEINKDIFDIILLSLMHNVPLKEVELIVFKVMDKFKDKINPEIESKIHAFRSLHERYRNYVEFYDFVIQDIWLDEFDRARFFHASHLMQKRLALFKFIDQLGVAKYLAVKDDANSSSVFYVLMNAAKLFSLNENVDTKRKYTLEKELPNIFLQEHYNLAGDRYIKIEQEVEKKYSVKYRELFQKVPKYLENEKGTGLVNVLRALFNSGELTKLGISNKIKFFYRIKELHRLEKKMKQGRNGYDIVGIKGVIDEDLSIGDIYNMIQKLYKLLEKEFFKKSAIAVNDYFAEPKANGYANVFHYDIDCAINKVPLELQLVGIQDDIRNQYSRKNNHFIYSGRLEDIGLKEVIVYLDLASVNLIGNNRDKNVKRSICDLGKAPNLFKLLFDIFDNNKISITNLDKNYYFEIFQNNKYVRVPFDDYCEIPTGALLRLRQENKLPSPTLKRELDAINLKKLSETTDKLPPRTNGLKLSIAYKDGRIHDKIIPSSYNYKEFSLFSLLIEFCDVSKLPEYFNVFGFYKDGEKTVIDSENFALTSYHKIEFHEVPKTEKSKKSLRKKDIIKFKRNPISYFIQK